MRIKSVHIRDFKRFTDLKIEDIPETANLIVLVGPNGSGKSSLFEALNFRFSHAKGHASFERDYHIKENSKPNEVIDNYKAAARKITIEFYNGFDLNVGGTTAKKAFYVRSAYRHEPAFSISSVSRQPEILQDSDAPRRLIDTEQRVNTNYQRIVWNAVNGLWHPDNRSKLVGNLVDELIGEVRDAVGRVFNDLYFVGVGAPTQNGTFCFDKGTIKNYRYENLSGGEKAAFDLLLDFVVKRRYFDDTVFCIDEPELHMHTKLQSRLLNEMYCQLPDKCQLWIATHSVGMMRYAMDLYEKNPEQVVFLDFSNHDFDKEIIMYPVKVTRQFWRDIFSVAMDDLAELVAPSEIVFCEGKPETGSSKDKTFDAEIYRQIFSERHPNTEFVPLGSHSETEKNSVLIETVMQKLFTTVKMWRMFDRDDRSEEEILELNTAGTRVLRYRDIETYLWSDEVLKLLCEEQNQPHLISVILSEKQRLLAELPTLSKPKPTDDVKSIAGQLYNYVKKTLSLTQCGNTAEAFAKTMLVPLIMPGTTVYQQLEDDIFGIS